MKKLFIVFAIIAISSVRSSAQEAKPATGKPKQDLNAGTNTVNASTLTTKPKPQVTLVTPPKAVKRHSVWRGIFPQASKADNPLQLINPFAPASYGDGSANTAIDPITGKSHGLRAVSLEF